MTKARLAVLCALVLAAPAAAKDIRVAADGSGDYKTLLKGLKAAAPGDVVIIKKAGGMVGMALNKNAGGFVVERTVPGSPAESAGVQPGERLISVDGVDAANRTLEEVIALIRGPMDTIVNIKVAEADGSAPRDIAITRGAGRWPIKDAADKFRVAKAELDHEATSAFALPLAEGGLLEAQTWLAYAYQNGLGVSVKPKEAFRWAKQAADGGDPGAQRLLAYLYSTGSGVEKEPRLFFHWTRQAAEKGDAPAMLNLSYAYEYGVGTTKDRAAALNWARRTASSNSPTLTADYADKARLAVARLEAPDTTSPEYMTAQAAAFSGATPAKPAAPAAPAEAPTVRSDIDDLPAQRAIDPKAVALVIGVERYREALPKADFAASDAKLAGEYFKRVLGVSEENLAMLVDDRATKSDFEKYIEQWLPNHVEAGSKVYVYFSGHGAPDAAKGDSYLVPYDGDPTYIKLTGYSLKRLYANLGKLPAASVTVAMDSCFSGAGGRSVLAKGARPLVNIKTDLLPPKLTVLSASGAAEISNSYQEKGHGLFTYFLLKGMKEKGADFKAAYDYLAPEVSRAARRQYNSDQTPQWRQAK